MHPTRLLATLALSLACGGCVHLLQPQTYRPNARIDRQRSEYLAKELVHGLSEETFKRWYTRTPDWADPLRPSISSQEVADGATTYRVTGGPGLVGEVTFRDGRLDQWSSMQLMQESVASVWMERAGPGHAVDAATLERIERLDPPSEVLNAADPPDRPTACRLEAGDVIESTIPLMVNRAHGNSLGVVLRRPDGSLGDNPILPAGTRLTVDAWDVVHGRRFTGPDGTRYKITDSVSLRRQEGIFCPVGVCPRPGDVMTTTRDLDLGISDDSKSESIAVLERRTRIPVWMRREVLPAGSRVTVFDWDVCDSLKARIFVEGGGAAADRAYSVPFAPPGLFAPASAS